MVCLWMENGVVINNLFIYCSRYFEFIKISNTVPLTGKINILLEVNQFEDRLENKDQFQGFYKAL